MDGEDWNHSPAIWSVCFPGSKRVGLILPEDNYHILENPLVLTAFQKHSQPRYVHRYLE